MKKRKTLAKFDNVFFAKDRTQALARLKMLEMTEGKYYKGKTVILNKFQVPHISKWKTWKMIKVKRKK